MTATASAPLASAIPDIDAAFAAASALGEHQVVRFQGQAAFARALARTLKREGEWLPLVARAEAIMAAAIGGGTAALGAALAQAEAVLAPLAPEAKSFTLQCAGHAHIDMNWMWGWHETVGVTVDTFATVLNLMDEFPEFHFTQSQASVYAIIAEHHPEMLERIRARVREGRWEVAAAHWVEGDRNLAGGEALCRHLLYTRRYLGELFGLKPEDVPLDWCPDTFGHAATMPGIDAGGAVKYYYLCRPGPLEGLPAVFWWQGADGSRVLVNRELHWYNGQPAPSRAVAALDFFAQTGLRDQLLVYGIGDHGGGPTRRDLRRIIDMDAWPVFPRFRFASATSWFRRAEAAGGAGFPTIARELNYEFSGCYTSQAAIKKANRAGEIIVAEADHAAAIAMRALQRPYPAQKLRSLWREVLFTHFHDILPGSGVRATREHCLGQHQMVVAGAGQIRSQALRALAAAIDTGFAGLPATATVAVPELDSTSAGGGVGRDVGLSTVGDGPRAVVAFNPVDAARSEAITVTVWDADAGPRPTPLKDRQYVAHLPDGRTVLAQRLGHGGYWGHDFVEVAVPVSVGPFGWQAVTIAEATRAQAAAAAPAQPPVTVLREIENANCGWAPPLAGGRVAIANQHVRVGFDRKSGGIVSLIDVASGIEVATGEAMAVPEYGMERAVGMSAWVLGDVPRREAFACTACDVTQNGPWVAAVRSEFARGDSKFTVEYTVRAGQPWVEVAISGTWMEKGAANIGVPRLAMRFPFALDGARARYEIPAGAIARSEPAGREVPALRWAAVDGAAGDAGRRAGCALFNDGKHGHSVDGGTLQLNLIRSSYDPDPLPEIGQHQIRLGLAPWAGERDAAAITRMAAAFNQPTQVVGTSIHRGSLPAGLAAGIACDRAEVMVTQVKGAEDGAAVVIRVQNTAERAVAATLTLAEAVFGRVAGAVATDLLERPVAGRTAAVAGQQVTVTVPAQGLATVAVECR